HIRRPRKSTFFPYTTLFRSLIDGSIAAGMTNTNGWDRTQIRKLDNGVAAFNDLLRNALKGDPDGQGRGFLQGDMDYNKMQESSTDRKSTRLNSSHVKISYAV